ncbi:helix-turn-helix transcriptional regulator [Enterococcus faecalis]|uniref:helix-turn-helix domain-containing protein n=1 Tax=Enterococcus faecalis TaxID=1351 RepID=UPI0025B0A0AB|nr:helix-turn-helix transcriptional regulator [Enterococcus faecalis]MDN3095149.1 helix-turn-helix transcriptional regulator [Enterococcus faecalis]
MEQNTLRNFIAKRVKYFRREAKLSQEKLSEMANLEPKYINKLENEKYNIKTDTLEQILTALDVSLEEFFNFQFPTNSEKVAELVKSLEKIREEDQEEVFEALRVLINKIS